MTKRKLPFEVHPAAEQFPMMKGDEFEAFVKDIEQNGVREPIIIWKGKLLDGRNRSAACMRLGMNPLDYACDLESDDVDPVAYVVSANIHRRHLGLGQRALIAAGLAKIGHGGDRRSDEFKGQNCTLKQAADLLNVGERTAKEARAVLTSGDDETIRAVKSGDMSVHKAAKTVAAKTKAAPSGQMMPGGDNRLTENFAITKADVSITQLKGIPKSNKFRDAALARAGAWIAEQRGKQSATTSPLSDPESVALAFQRTEHKLGLLRSIFDTLSVGEVAMVQEWCKATLEADQ